MRTLGIILAGGNATRLYPSTLVVTKQLLSVYDKPMIYYPLTTLMLANIREYIIIVSPEQENNFIKLFQHAKEELGINIRIVVQPKPTGIADSFNIVYNIMGEEVFEFDSHALILGDNIFFGSGFQGLLRAVQYHRANIFLYPVHDSHRYGIVEIEGSDVISIEEKPEHPKSNLAVTGLYFYPKDVYIKVKEIVPSTRGELEITDINKLYITGNHLHAIKLLRGMVWFDSGTPESLLEASNFIYSTQKHQRFLIGSPHEVAISMGWASKDGIDAFVEKSSNTEYGKYIKETWDSFNPKGI